MMKMQRTEPCGRRDDLSRNEVGNRAEIKGLRFHLEEAETRCSRLTYKDKESSL